MVYLIIHVHGSIPGILILLSALTCFNLNTNKRKSMMIFACVIYNNDITYKYNDFIYGFWHKSN